MSPSPEGRSTLLRQRAHAFCHALVSPPPPLTLLKQRFTSFPQIHEHGPSWSTRRLPFLGKTFTGLTGSGSCEEYFTLLSQHLKVQLDEESFPGLGGFAVAGDVVFVSGKGTFEGVETGRKYEEAFVYMLSGFDEEGKIGKWEIWSDGLSAWKAVVGSVK